MESCVKEWRACYCDRCINAHPPDCYCFDCDAQRGLDKIARIRPRTAAEGASLSDLIAMEQDRIISGFTTPVGIAGRPMTRDDFTRAADSLRAADANCPRTTIAPYRIRNPAAWPEGSPNAQPEPEPPPRVPTRAECFRADVAPLTDYLNTRGDI